ncbi:hypothetical protein ACFSTC_06925 [Nonomuraea ferruginea]
MELGAAAGGVLGDADLRLGDLKDGARADGGGLAGAAVLLGDRVRLGGEAAAAVAAAEVPAKAAPSARVAPRARREVDGMRSKMCLTMLGDCSLLPCRLPG